MSHVSLCFLSFERPHFLREAVESALTHADEPIELIIHDDGSTDPQVKSYLWALHESGLASHIMLSAPGHNEGLGVAMNRCFSVASGDILCKADQDLIFKPHWLERVRSILGPATTGPPIGVLAGFHYWHDPCDWRKTLKATWDVWEEHEYIMGSFMAIPRQAWRELGPFDEHSPAFSEDHIFQRKVTDSGVWACGIPVTDLMHNQGYGIGPSTVVPAPGEVRKIHEGPKLVAP